MNIAEGELLAGGARHQAENELWTTVASSDKAAAADGSASSGPMIAIERRNTAELAATAIRDAIGIGGGSAPASLRRVDADGAVEVADQGAVIVPGASRSGLGLGSGVDRELIGRMGGRPSVEAAEGARARVVFPPVRRTGQASA